ncbi:hypothetical protein FXO38_02164 [Capsicum annuum]|nr:hypothetical protein FXO38_02164 [Capsicum annuum]
MHSHDRSYKYKALKRKLKDMGISVFKDDVKLERGKHISAELLKAIEESRIAIIIFSEDYASSTWCLEELATIMECVDQKEQTAYPVFYNVEPSDLCMKGDTLIVEGTTSQTVDSNEMKNMRVTLEAMTQTLERLSTEVGAIRGEVTTISGRLEQVESQRNTRPSTPRHVSSSGNDRNSSATVTPETWPQLPNPSLALLNAARQTTYNPLNRDSNRPTRSQISQVPQEEKKSRYAIAYFEGYANTWWEYVKRFDNELVEVQPPPWFRLRYLMRQRYLPESYHHELLSRLYNLRQGNRSVMAYYDEFQQLMLKLDHRGEQIGHDIIRFKCGLNKEISTHLTLHKFDTVEGIFQADLEIERELKERSLFKAKGSSTSGWPRSKDMCQGWGHKAIECPNRRNVILRKRRLYYLGEEVGLEKEENEAEPQDGEKPKNEPHDDDDCEDAYPQEGECVILNFVVRRAMISKAIDDPSQRENLFHTKCLLKGSVYTMVIDSGSCANMVSVEMVNLLKLLTTPHTSPYKFQCLNECGELKVTRQCMIRFKVANYHDEVLCDMIPMEACHLLLGRPWQYDRSTKHDGRSNRYTLEKDGRKVALYSLLPSQVNELYQKMWELRKKGKKDESEGKRGETESEGDYEDVFPKELPQRLANKPAYRSNPMIPRNYNAKLRNSSTNDISRKV